MARRKLSEYRAKVLLGTALGEPYTGISADTTESGWHKTVAALTKGRYVVKVDQAVKRRFHLGLLFVDRSEAQVTDDVTALAAKGFQYCLVEPLRQHAPAAERYVALEQRREGLRISYATRGGVDVEHDPEAMQNGWAEQPADLSTAAKELGVPVDWLTQLVAAFERNYLSFLEINPLVVDANGIAILDAAVEVDDAAALAVDSAWSAADYRHFLSRPITQAERAVAELAAHSQASLSLEVLNPNGAVFLLLSGGGASVVVADEVVDRGCGALLANYGEYSGNPTTDETKLYTAAVLELLLASTAHHKVLIIAGAVANFTDVRATFQGITAALRQQEDKLQQQGVKIYIRRGGPHEKEALTDMRTYLDKAGLLGAVAGPELVLTDIVGQALAEVEPPGAKHD
jgi:ATP-citrate lyase beta-subunit